MGARSKARKRAVDVLYEAAQRDGDRRGDLVWTDGAGHIVLSLSTGTAFADSASTPRKTVSSQSSPRRSWRAGVK